MAPGLTQEYCSTYPNDPGCSQDPGTCTDEKMQSSGCSGAAAGGGGGDPGSGCDPEQSQLAILGELINHAVKANCAEPEPPPEQPPTPICSYNSFQSSGAGYYGPGSMTAGAGFFSPTILTFGLTDGYSGSWSTDQSVGRVGSATYQSPNFPLTGVILNQNGVILMSIFRSTYPPLTRRSLCGTETLRWCLTRLVFCATSRELIINS